MLRIKITKIVKSREYIGNLLSENLALIGSEKIKKDVEISELI